MDGNPWLVRAYSRKPKRRAAGILVPFYALFDGFLRGETEIVNLRSWKCEALSRRGCATLLVDVDPSSLGLPCQDLILFGLQNRAFCDLTLKHVAAFFGRYISAIMDAEMQAWNQVGQIIINIRDFILRCCEALQSSALWIVHLPKAVASTISQWISDIGRAISIGIHAVKVAVIVFLKVLTVLTVTALALPLLGLGMWKLVEIYQHYRRKKQMQMQREQWEQCQREETERLSRMWKEVAGRQQRDDEIRQRERREQERREQERKQKGEEDRRREQEQRRRQKEQGDRRRAEGDRRAYRQWRAQCETFLAHRESTTRFPDPPSWPCTAGCPDNEVLKACRHSIKRLYQASSSNLQETLRNEKRAWHPDRFERCPPISRQKIKAKAVELFKIIQELEGEILRETNA